MAMVGETSVLQDWHRLYYLVEPDKDDFAVTLLMLVKYDEKRRVYVAQHFTGTYRQTRSQIRGQAYGSGERYGAFTESLYALGYWKHMCHSMEEEVIGATPTEVREWEISSLPAQVFYGCNPVSPFLDAWEAQPQDQSGRFEPVIVISRTDPTLISVPKSSLDLAITPERVLSSLYWMSDYELHNPNVDITYTLVKTKALRRGLDGGKAIALMPLRFKSVASNMKDDPFFRLIANRHADEGIKLVQVKASDLDVQLISKFKFVSVGISEQFNHLNSRNLPFTPFHVGTRLISSEGDIEDPRALISGIDNRRGLRYLAIKKSEDIQLGDSVEQAYYPDIITLGAIKEGELPIG